MGKAEAARNILFITWDGPQTRYLERLFLPILAGLGAQGYRCHVLQFTWAGSPEDEAVIAARAGLCAAEGVPFRQVRIWRRPGGVGPFLSAVMGARAIRRAVAAWGIGTLMPRSLMPALAVLCLRRAERRALRILFDADGLAADERVEFGGLSPHGATYRLLRDIEARMLRQADGVLVRTEAARDIVLARAGAALAPARCHVVPNGVAVAPFAEALAACAAARDAGFVLGYCGSVGVQYRLPDMLDIAMRLRETMPDLRLRLLSPARAEVMRALAAKNLAGAGWIEQRAVPAAEIPGELVRLDLGLALRVQSFSTRAVQPIKLGEYLLAGVPVIGTPGVGMTEALEEAGVFRSAEPEDWQATLRWIIDEVRGRREEMRQACHAIGLGHFSLAATVEAYRVALEAVAETGAKR